MAKLQRLFDVKEDEMSNPRHLSRHGSNSFKWDFTHRDPNLLPVIPLWVADMDFTVPEAVSSALNKRIQHPIYGYTLVPDDYFQAVVNWYSRHFDRKVDQKHLVLCPSVMHGLSMAIRKLTKIDEFVLSLTPVYGPFATVVIRNQRQLLEVSFRRTGENRNQWDLDFEAIETAILNQIRKGSPIRILLFCNPQNPTGRVWNRNELKQIAELCQKYEIVILSDEIHCDLVQPDYPFVSCADLEEFSERCIVLAGPNKTFNLAGLSLSHFVIPDQTLRNAIQDAIHADFFEQPNSLALAAALAAYQYGDEWLRSVLRFVALNKLILDQFLEQISLELGLNPRIYSSELQGTYLSWVDFSPLIAKFGLRNETDLAHLLEREARVKLSPGAAFRGEDRGFLRFNLALGKEVFQEALDRLEKWFVSRSKCLSKLT